MIRLFLSALAFCVPLPTESFAPEVEDALARALAIVPDAGGIVKVRTETNRKDFEPFTGVGNLSDGIITGTYAHGFNEQVKNGVRTEISWIANACVCLDIQCDTTGLVDIRLFGNGRSRGSSPLLLMNSSSDTPMPCLSIHVLNYTDLEVVGCDTVADSLVWYQGLYASNCTNGTISSLRLIDKRTGKVMARPWNSSELLPNDVVDFSEVNTPGVTIGDLVNDAVQIDTLDEINVVLRILFVVVSFSIGVQDQLQTGTELFVDGIIDSAFNFFLPLEFGASASPATEATFSDLLRVFLSFDRIRLLRASADTPKKAEDGLSDSALLREAIDSMPESQPVAEILSLAVLLFLSCCYLGTATASLKHYMSLKHHTNRATGLVHLVKCGAALLACVANATAYALLWKTEQERMDFRQSITVVDLTGGGRFGGAAVFRVGQDFDPFIVAVYNVQVSNASPGRTLILAIGVVVSLVGLVVSCLAPSEEEVTEEGKAGTTV